MNEILKAIVQTKLNISTLETRGSDRLDFHELSVWQLKAALEEAYYAGMRVSAEMEQGKTWEEANDSGMAIDKG